MSSILPKKIFFVSLVGCTFLFICYLLFLLLNPAKDIQDNTLLQPTPFPASQSRQELEYPKTRRVPFKIVSVQPPEDKTGKFQYSPIKDIVVTFNKEVNPTRIQLLVTPSITLDARMGKNGEEVLISPPAPSFWKPGVLYTVTISSQTQALDGTTLQSDYDYSIMTILSPGGP